MTTPACAVTEPTTMFHHYYEPLIPLLEDALIPISLADATAPDRELVFVNRAFEALTGYSRNEVLGRNCRFLQGPATDPLVRAQIRDALGRQSPFSGVLCNYKKDGTPFHNLLVIRPLRASKSGLQMFMGCQFSFNGQFDLAELQAHLDVEQGLFKHLSAAL
jgi:PAS domain S-box-containing protein